MNFSEILEKFIEREAKIHATRVSITGPSVFNESTYINCKHMAKSLKPIVLKLYEFAKSRRCKTYIGIATPGVEVSVHDDIRCQKCKLLAEVEHMIGGGGV